MPSLTISGRIGARSLWTIFVPALFLFLVVLCFAQPARANAITLSQYESDLAIVDTGIANHLSLFSKTVVAQHDYAAALAAGALAIEDLATKDPVGAQVDFQNAINDFNGVLLSLGLPALPGSDPPVPEPASLLQLAAGLAAIVFVLARRRRSIGASSLV